MKIVHQIKFMTGKIPPNGQGIAQLSRAIRQAMDEIDLKYETSCCSAIGYPQGFLKWTISVKERPEEAAGAIYHALKFHLVEEK